MITQMEISEIYDPEIDQHISCVVDVDTLEFWKYVFDNTSENDFFFAACDYLEVVRGFDCDHAKIQIWYDSSKLA